jgi:hypothetical protein
MFMQPLRKRLAVVLIAGSALVLGVTGLPAYAGQLTIPDPAGDATGIDSMVRSTPRPSDPELDILNVSYATTPTELQIDMKVAKVGVPVASQGFTYRVRFGHGGKDYEFLYQVLDLPGFNRPLFALRPGGAEGSQTTIACRCSGKVNGKTATLEIRAEINSLSRGIRAHSPGAPPIGPGTKLTNLVNVTDRLTAFLLFPADYAEAKSGTTFTI